MVSKKSVSELSAEDPFEFPLESSLGFLLRDVGRTVGKALAQRIEPQGASVPIWFLLRLLSENEGLTQREISKRLGIMEPSAVETLRTMEDQGLISRPRNPDDRRKIAVRLTPKGWTLLDQLLPLALEVNELIVQAGTPAEVKTLTKMLQRLRHDLLA